jgi:hypothetical protein
VKTGERRGILVSGARLAAAAALGALAATLGLRRQTKRADDGGYCDRAGRCRGCEVTADCDVYQAMHGGPRP